MRCASSTGALPGASSGRQRRQGRKPACSAACGAVEEAAVRRLRRLRRADRAAVDAGRGHADEEHAVEAGVAGGEGGVEPAVVVGHGWTIGRAAAGALAIFGHHDRAVVAVRKWRAGRGRAASLSLATIDPDAQEDVMPYVSKQVRSPVGLLTLVASERGLAGILWPDDPPGRVRLDAAEEAPDHPVLGEAERQLAGVLRGAAHRVRPAARSRGHPVPAEGVERAPEHSVRGDPHLRRGRDPDRTSRRRPRCGCRERPEPALHRGAVPSRGRHRRRAHRVCRRSRGQGPAAGVRAGRLSGGSRPALVPHEVAGVPARMLPQVVLVVRLGAVPRGRRLDRWS